MLLGISKDGGESTSVEFKVQSILKIKEEFFSPPLLISGLKSELFLDYFIKKIVQYYLVHFYSSDRIFV